MTIKVPGEFQMTPGTCVWCGNLIKGWIALRWCDDCCDRWLALPLDERKKMTPREFFEKGGP
jgi:hypothetical protein